MFTRRDLIRMGLVGAGYAILPTGRQWSPVSSAFGDTNAPTSPATTPFVRPLPVPPQAQEVPPFFDAINRPTAECEPFVTPATRYFRIVAEERYVSVHPQIPPTAIWGYRDDTFPEGEFPFAVGPTLGGLFGFNQIGNGIFVRHVNNLPVDHSGFGVPITTVHFHGGHHLSSADGFPTNIEGFPDFLTLPGGHYDHCYPLLDPGFLDFNRNGGPATLLDVSERPSTLWYHDHLLDFTSQNVYRGLAGIAVMQDELDSGDEEDPNPEALRLPGYPDFDIPLVIQDKRFNRDGSLWYDTFDHDGFLGDKFLVNGAVQPYMEVERRKYRFRFLNASNARIYQFFLADKLGFSYPMTQIGTEGGLLSRPITIQSFQIGMAERVEVVIDFAAPEFALKDELYFENRLRQTEGRKPDGVQSRGPQFLQFPLRPAVPDNDPSRVGKLDRGELVLRRFDKTSNEVLAQAYQNLKTFRFDRSGGGWTINGKPAGDLERARTNSPVDEPEIWRLVNDSGGWWHPVHIHSEFGRIIRRNGGTPPLREQDGIAKKDTYLLRDNESVDVFLQFRDFKGPFTFHCHNLEHEDMAMMARFDVV